MRIHHHAFTALCVTAALAAQKSPDQEKTDPLVMVARAEALLKAKETESAILVLWDARDVVATLPKNAVNDSVATTARQLLAANDALDARRRAVFASVSKQQVELAALYRAKKWFDVAATRLAVADRYDAEVAAKERTLLEGARRSAKAPEPSATAPMKSRLSPLLQRDNTEYVDGEWREVGDTLECQAPNGVDVEWVAKARHADHEVVVEFRGVQPTGDYNAILAVGLNMLQEGENFSGYRLLCQHFPGGNEYVLALHAVHGSKITKLGSKNFDALPPADGFHRLSVRIDGKQLRGQLDGAPPLEVTADADVSGQVGLLQGVTRAPTCPVQFRNFRIDPLPADMPTDEELRAKAAAETQNAITKAVDAAKDLIAKKQPEPASTLLRDALARIRKMTPGVLRDNLDKSVEQMLIQTDPFTARRKKTAQTIAAELVVLADEYEKAGMARAAEAVVRHALDFDPTLTARETAAREAVQKWNAAQAAARAPDLAPPDDDGTALREWFATGRQLFGAGPKFTFDGAVARTEALINSIGAYHVMAADKKPIAKASLSVHLPADGAQAGLCFDVVDFSHFGVVQLHRTPNGIHLESFLRVGNRWTPLMRQEVPMDEWRRDAWHRLSIEADGTGLVALCNGVRIQTPRNLLNKQTGVMALYANNETAQPMIVELRAFTPEK